MDPIESIRELQNRLNEAVKHFGLEALQVSLTPGGEHSFDTLHCTFAVNSSIAFKSSEEIETERQFREIALNERAQEQIKKYDDAKRKLLEQIGQNPEDFLNEDSSNYPAAVGEQNVDLPALDDEIANMDISELLRRLSED